LDSKDFFFFAQKRCNLRIFFQFEIIFSSIFCKQGSDFQYAKGLQVGHFPTPQEIESYPQALRMGIPETENVSE